MKEGILKSLALLLAGALISVLTSLYIALLRIYWLLLVLILIFLLLYGFGIISPLHWINKLRRELLSPKVGILNDMGWDTKNEQIHTWTDISPENWKNELKKIAKGKDIRIKVEFINVNKSFDSYVAIINPYGGVYPEYDLKNFETMNKILNYVSKEGLFVNVADIPCYYAYNPLLKRRLDITPPIYGIDRTPDGKILIIPVRPFELTPLMEKLGLRVLNVEKQQVKNDERPEIISEPYRWDVEFEDKFNEIMEKVDEIKVHRVVVVERNAEPIIKSKRFEQTDVTPVFFVIYGDGKFLISLVFENYQQNSKMKEVLAEIIIKLIRDKSKRND